MRQKKIWVVAAGTGGHIFPGLSVARAIKQQDPAVEFLFFGSADRLEAKLIPQAGFNLKLLKAGQWKGRNALARLLNLGRLLGGFCQALSLGFREKPVCLVSVGGYVSVPVALASLLRGVPLFLIEPNIRSGLANRLLSYFATQAFCAPGSDAMKVLKCRVIDAGNPTREDLKPVECREKVKQLLVLGGSQGALSLCKATLQLCAEGVFKKAGIQVLLQCGQANFEYSKKMALDLQVDQSQVQITPFIDDVASTLLKSDVVVARAGAMTVAELSISGHPTIFVPFPFAADDHQRVNAELLEKDGAALMVQEKDDFVNHLRESILYLCQEPESDARRKALSQRILRWGRPRAAQEIAQQILSLIPRSE